MIWSTPWAQRRQQRLLNLLLLQVSIGTVTQSWMHSSSSLPLKPSRPVRWLSSSSCSWHSQDYRTKLSASSSVSTAPFSKQQRTLSYHNFTQQVIAAFEDSSLLSFTVKGGKRKSHPKKENPGDLRLVTGRPVMLKQKRKLQMTFKYHKATDTVQNWDSVETMGEGLRILLLVEKENSPSTNNGESNLVPASEWGCPREGAVFQSWRTAVLKTSTHSVVLLRDGSLRQEELQPSTRGMQLLEQQQNHDRVKNGAVQRTDPFWQALGVTDNTGRVRRGSSSKLKQCQKFVEILQRLLQDAAVSTSSAVSVTDMGCGRGYLTFALHHALAQQYDTVTSLGMDLRPKLVAEIDHIAQTLGPPFDTLQFLTGSIGTEHLRTTQGSINNTASVEDRDDMIRVLVALHACDTATDDALWAGIATNHDVIVVAPCCHRETRAQIDKLKSSNAHALFDILRHNTYRERACETVTDALRALLLQLAGYKVQVFEFIGGDHTSKNVMITAVRGRRQRTQEHDDSDGIAERIVSLAALYGIREQKLARLMGVSLVS